MSTPPVWYSVYKGSLVCRATDWRRVVVGGQVAGEWTCGACRGRSSDFESVQRTGTVAECVHCRTPNRVFDRLPAELRPSPAPTWTDHAFITAGKSVALWMPSSTFTTRAPSRCFGCGDWQLHETRQSVIDHARNCTAAGVALAS